MNTCAAVAGAFTGAGLQIPDWHLFPDCRIQASFCPARGFEMLMGRLGVQPAKGDHNIVVQHAFWILSAIGFACCRHSRVCSAQDAGVMRNSSTHCLAGNH